MLMSDKRFNITKLYHDSRQVLFKPKTYFSSMETEGGWEEPILQTFLYGVLSGLFILLWSLLDVIGITEGVFSGDVGVVGFFSTIFGAVIGLFIGAFIILIISAISDGKRDFDSCLRIAAAIMVLLPVNAFLGFFDGISYVLGAVLSLGVNLYGVYMLYIALTVILKAESKPARTISYILAGLLVLFLVAVLFARNAVMKYNERIERERREMVREMNGEIEVRGKARVHSQFFPKEKENIFHSYGIP